MAIYFSFLLIVMTFLLITDFSNVLFDSRDKYILFPRPVNDRTLVLARLLHVFIYLFRIVLPMSLPAWVMLGYVDGWKSAVLFPLPLIMMVFMALFIVNSVYLIVLQMAKPEKFKDVINYFQVITSVIFFASVYLLPRFFDPEHPRETNILDHAWLKFAPSYWLAGMLVVDRLSCAACLAQLYLSILAVILPVVACMFILVNKLAPQIFAQDKRYRYSGI